MENPKQICDAIKVKNGQALFENSDAINRRTFLRFVNASMIFPNSKLLTASAFEVKVRVRYLHELLFDLRQNRYRFQRPLGILRATQKIRLRVNDDSAVVTAT